jgi:hypothetical protein
MMAVAVHATQAPIHPNFGPSVFAKAPMGPERVPFPIPNSRIRRGMDQRRRKTTQATRNDPPPFVAAIRGNLQMFPVPTAIPTWRGASPTGS